MKQRLRRKRVGKSRQNQDRQIAQRGKALDHSAGGGGRHTFGIPEVAVNNNGVHLFVSRVFANSKQRLESFVIALETLGRNHAQLMKRRAGVQKDIRQLQKTE